MQPLKEVGYVFDAVRARLAGVRVLPTDVGWWVVIPPDEERAALRALRADASSLPWARRKLHRATTLEGALRALGYTAVFKLDSYDSVPRLPGLDKRAVQPPPSGSLAVRSGAWGFRPRKQIGAVDDLVLAAIAPHVYQPSVAHSHDGKSRYTFGGGVLTKRQVVPSLLADQPELG